MKKLGVIIPVYNTPDRNRSGYLKDALSSVLAQDLDFTCLVIDNGSTDPETLDIYETIRDTRFKLFPIGRGPNQNPTPSRSLNLGLNHLFDTGHEAFCYSHSDDVLTPNSLELRIQALKDNEMVYGKIAYFLNQNVNTDNRDAYNNSNSPPLEVLRSTFPHHTSMWDRKLMELMLKEKNGLIFSEGVIANEDICGTLCSRKVMERESFNLGFIDDYLYIWFNHKGNITNMTDLKKREQSTRECYEYYGFDTSSLTQTTWKSNFTRPGFWLPESIKEKLRPLASKINKLTFGKIFPEGERLKLTNLDPYWFRESKRAKTLRTPLTDKINMTDKVRGHS